MTQRKALGLGTWWLIMAIALAWAGSAGTAAVSAAVSLSFAVWFMAIRLNARDELAADVPPAKPTSPPSTGRQFDRNRDIYVAGQNEDER